MNVNDALFEKVFFQSAHIAILDLALRETKSYLEMLVNDSMMQSDFPEQHKIMEEALKRIVVAYSSIERLKKGEIPSEG
jgi:hypothetical protein